MSPKEKAKELVFKKFGCKKQYALIAVDEILKENERINLGGEFPTPLTNYWQEVKQEIEKL